MKIIYYESVKVIINTSALAEITIDIVVCYHGLLNSIVTNWGSLFTSKFRLSICYFLGIKRRLLTTFYPQTNSQTERQNNTINGLLRAFVNYEQNDWVGLLLMVEFAYNNAKNASTGYTAFELNCRFYSHASYKKDVNPHSQTRSIKELATKLKELMIR